MASDARSSNQSGEEIPLHDPVPEFGEWSGAWTAPRGYYPDIHMCQTCSSKVESVYMMAAVEVGQQPDGTFKVVRFYNPALNTLQQVTAMLEGENFSNVGQSEQGLIVIKQSCYKCIGIDLFNDSTHFVNGAKPPNHLGVILTSAWRKQRRAARSADDPDKEYEVISRHYDTLCKRRRRSLGDD